MHEQSDQLFVYDGWNVVEVLNANAADVNASGAIVAKYTWGLDLSGLGGAAGTSGIHGAGGIGGLLAAVETGTTGSPVHWYFYDGNGNVGQTLLVAGNPTTITTAATYEYDPYGNAVKITGGTAAAVNPFRFSTKWFDAENGLYYYGYRYYNPRLGRWISRDPVHEPGHVLPAIQRQTTRFILRDAMENNEYVSFRNNAVGWFDPTGEDSATQPAAQPKGAPVGSDCGIEIHQSPLCLIGGGNGGQLGHTWLTWGSGGPGEAADCPAGKDWTYINTPEAECQKKYVNNKWHVTKVDTGTFTLNGSSRSCKNASCADIKACLLEKTLSCSGFDKKRNNCRQFVDKAMAGSCLGKADLFYVDVWMPIKYCCSGCAKHQTPGLR